MPKWWHLEQYNNETGYNVIFNFYHHKITFFVAFLSQMKSFEYTEIPLGERTMSLCLCVSD